MSSDLSQKYAQLKAMTTGSADIDLVSDLMEDILQLLHNQFAKAAGQQKGIYEQAYSLLNCTLTAHQLTRQDTHNPCYVNEVGLQVGRDIERALRKKKTLHH